jgi:hypothetical protein
VWGKKRTHTTSYKSIIGTGYFTKGGTIVKKHELKQKLIMCGVPDDMISLNGGLPNEAYCLDKRNNLWEVYYSEKGIKSDLQQFKSEEKACDYFYELIIKALNV